MTVTTTGVPFFRFKDKQAFLQTTSTSIWILIVMTRRISVLWLWWLWQWSRCTNYNFVDLHYFSIRNFVECCDIVLCSLFHPRTEYCTLWFKMRTCGIKLIFTFIIHETIPEILVQHWKIEDHTLLGSLWIDNTKTIHWSAFEMVNVQITWEIWRLLRSLV